MLLDQLPHDRPAPQGEGQTEFVRRMPADQSADLSLLLDTEKTSRAKSRTQPLVGRRFSLVICQTWGGGSVLSPLGSG